MGDSIDKQVFDVQFTHRGLLFKHLSNGGRLIQLGDSTFMAFDNWDLEDDRLCKRGKDSGLKSLSAIDSRYAFGAILLNILQIIFSITEPQTL